MATILRKLKLCFTTLCVVFSYTSTAQPPSPGEHLYWPNMDNFIGTWKWVNGTDEVTIKLKKIHLFNARGNFYSDDIMGSHCYIQNGITIENTLAEFPNIGQFSRSSIDLWYWGDDNTPNTLTGQLRDPLHRKNERLYLTYIPGTVPTIKWNVEPIPGAWTDKPGQLPRIPGYTMPEEII